MKCYSLMTVASNAKSPPKKSVAIALSYLRGIVLAV